LSASDPATPLISARDLRVSFGRGRHAHEVLHGVNFDVYPGRIFALVGESGSGKSVLSRTLLGLSGDGAQVQASGLRFGEHDLLGFAARDWRRLRGREVGFISQDALVSLDPLRRIGAEVGEVLRLHGLGNRDGRHARVLEALTDAGLTPPEEIARQRAGQLSGGMRQRALIAAAVVADPRALIADEPTTALDTTVQAQILALLASYADRGDAIVFVSHDLGVVGQLADDLAVLKAGEVVEQGPVERVLGDPQHEYTKLLLSAIPAMRRKSDVLTAAAPAAPKLVVVDQRLPAAPAAGQERPALVADSLVKHYQLPSGQLRTAVDRVSFEIATGTTLGLVGESGAGKSTIAGMLLGTVAPDSGGVWLGEHEWSALAERQRRPLRPQLQMIYQDPLSSFDPRHTVVKILGDALSVVGVEREAHRERSLALLERVGLGERQLVQHPLHLSGGQRQRVAIARALATNPSVILCDEPVSAVDASIQAQILDLLLELQAALGLTYLFISHDLGVVRHVSDAVMVLRHGRVVEQGTAEEVLDDPREAYTRQLLDAVPLPGRRLRVRPSEDTMSNAQITVRAQAQ